MTPIEIFAGVLAMTTCFAAIVWTMMQFTSPEPHVMRPAFSVLREAEAKRIYRTESVIRDRELLSELAKRVELAEQEIQKLKNRGVTKLEKMEYGDYISLDLYAERESKAWPLSGTHPDRH